MKTNKKFDGITTFAIDCDEVLRALLDNMLSLYNDEFGDNMTKEDIKNFDVEVSFPRIQQETGTTAANWFFQKHGFRLFALSPALPKIKEAIDKLREYGQVIIVTYQKSYKNKMDTLHWLMERGLEVDGVCFIKNKTLIHTDWLIDDNDWNLVGCNAKYGVLIDAPYNKDVSLQELYEKSNCEHMYRFGSLDEFVSWYVYQMEVEQCIY